MFNSQMPDISELPTSRQLIRSTMFALVGAGALLVTVVLPSEYGIDPTGAGRILGLTEMGEIKMQLADEAAADLASEPQFDDIPLAEAASNPAVALANRSDRKEITLEPGRAQRLNCAQIKMLASHIAGAYRVAPSITTRTAIRSSSDADSIMDMARAKGQSVKKAVLLPLLTARMAGFGAIGPNSA